MFDLVFGLLLGVVVGYGARAFISYQRRITTKRRLGIS